MGEFKKFKKRIFKPIKYLDAEIRTIENEQDSKGDIYYVVEVGLCESLGERGFNYSFFYEGIPTREEIIKDLKEYIKEEIGRLKKRMLGYYEEEHLKILEGLKI